MKEKYGRPVLYFEEFVANSYIAACGDTSQEVDFTCLQGPNIDTYHVLADSSTSSCSRRAKYITSDTVSKPSNWQYGYTRTNTTGGGWYVICVPVDNSSSYSTSEWSDAGVHTDSHNGNGGGGHGGHGGPGGGDNGQWHCMAAAVTNNVENVSFS